MDEETWCAHTVCSILCTIVASIHYHLQGDSIHLGSSSPGEMQGDMSGAVGVDSVHRHLRGLCEEEMYMLRCQLLHGETPSITKATWSALLFPSAACLAWDFHPVG